MIPLLLFTLALPALAAPPYVDKLLPLGWQRGASVEATFTGKDFHSATIVEFDSPGFHWKTIEASKTSLRGTLTVPQSAPLGPHFLRLRSPAGDSQTLLFNVGQFPPLTENEPNDTLPSARHLPALPVEIYGDLVNRAESDFFSFDAKAGDHLTFDLRSTEIGSYLEPKMVLLDAAGKRIAVSDDRSDFDDTPLIHHRFATSGRFYIHIDQYHGPRAADPKNSTYILRVSRLPYFDSIFPLGASPRATARITLSGTRLDTLTSASLHPLRLPEYYRFTYPHTIPVTLRPDPAAHITGRVVQRTPTSATLEFAIPASAPPGLYRLWTHSTHGAAEAFQFEISPTRELSENHAAPLRPGDAINARLSAPRERDSFPIQAVAGQWLHIYTHSAQFGLAPLDSVLQLRDPAGNLLAENDDLVTGAASLGNPDSSLFYLPTESATLRLTVRDRLNRGGSLFVYRLHIDHHKPAFQLWSQPDNFTVTRGQTGELTVRMTRDMGFEKDPVRVWFENLPPGIDIPPSSFRSDQAWEIGGDGLQMTTPEIVFPVRVPASVPAGRYAIRILGATPDGHIIPAHANLIRGPLTNLFNFTRRPLAEIFLTIVDPPTSPLAQSRP